VTTWNGPWTSPPAPRRGGAAAVLVVLAGVAVLLAALVAIPHVRGQQRTARGSTPKAALVAWLRAAESGELSRVRAVVAPSQRDLVRAEDPTGTGLSRLHLAALDVEDERPGAWAPDQVLVTVSRVVSCTSPPAHGTPLDKQEQCTFLVGSGPDGRALVVRERGRWWAVAQPVRVKPVDRSATELRVTISSHLVLRGGATVDERADSTLYGKTCAAWRGSSYGYSSDLHGDLDHEVRLSVSTRGAAFGPTLAPADVSAHIGIESLYQPSRAVPVQRAADGSSGSMVITHWTVTPFFDDPVPPPIDGALTWTCHQVS